MEMQNGMPQRNANSCSEDENSSQDNYVSDLNVRKDKNIVADNFGTNKSIPSGSSAKRKSYSIRVASSLKEFLETQVGDGEPTVVDKLISKNRFALFETQMKKPKTEDSTTGNSRQLRSNKTAKKKNNGALSLKFLNLAKQRRHATNSSKGGAEDKPLQKKHLGQSSKSNEDENKLKRTTSKIENSEEQVQPKKGVGSSSKSSFKNSKKPSSDVKPYITRYQTRLRRTNLRSGPKSKVKKQNGAKKDETTSSKRLLDQSGRNRMLKTSPKKGQNKRISKSDKALETKQSDEKETRSRRNSLDKSKIGRRSTGSNLEKNDRKETTRRNSAPQTALKDIKKDYSRKRPCEEAGEVVKKKRKLFSAQSALQSIKNEGCNILNKNEQGSDEGEENGKYPIKNEGTTDVNLNNVTDNVTNPKSEIDIPKCKILEQGMPESQPLKTVLCSEPCNGKSNDSSLNTQLETINDAQVAVSVEQESDATQSLTVLAADSPGSDIQLNISVDSHTDASLLSKPQQVNEAAVVETCHNVSCGYTESHSPGIDLDNNSCKHSEDAKNLEESFSNNFLDSDSDANYKNNVDKLENVDSIQQTAAKHCEEYNQLPNEEVAGINDESGATTLEVVPNMELEVANGEAVIVQVSDSASPKSKKEEKVKESILNALGLQSLSNVNKVKEKQKGIKAVIKWHRKPDPEEGSNEEMKQCGEYLTYKCLEEEKTEDELRTDLEMTESAYQEKITESIYQEKVTDSVYEAKMDFDGSSFQSECGNTRFADYDTSAAGYLGEHLSKIGIASVKEKVKKPLVVPEKSSSFSVHPDRVCFDVCKYCHAKFGMLDTPCHVGTLKNLERKRKILANEPNLKPDTCLCDACLRHVSKKVNWPANRRKQARHQATSFKRTMCAVQCCSQVARHFVKRKWLQKLRRKYQTMSFDVTQTGPRMTYGLCSEHFCMVEFRTFCGLCKKRLNNRSHPYSPSLQLAILNSVLREDSIAIELTDRSLLCKMCHYYTSVRIRLGKPSRMNASYRQSYLSFRRKILLKCGLSEENDDRDTSPISDTKPANSEADSEVWALSDDDDSNHTGFRKSDSKSYPVGFTNIASLLSPLEGQPGSDKLKDTSTRIQVKFGNLNIGKLSNLNIGQDSRTEINCKEKVPEDYTLPLIANLNFEKSPFPDKQTWEKCVSTIQFDKNTKKLWDDLQKPYGNQSSFLRHLIMLEKHWRAGSLVLSQTADPTAVKYITSVKNRVDSLSSFSTEQTCGNIKTHSMTPSGNIKTYSTALSGNVKTPNAAKKYTDLDVNISYSESQYSSTPTSVPASTPKTSAEDLQDSSTLTSIPTSTPKTSAEEGLSKHFTSTLSDTSVVKLVEHDVSSIAKKHNGESLPIADLKNIETGPDLESGSSTKNTDILTGTSVELKAPVLLNTGIRSIPVPKTTVLTNSGSKGAFYEKIPLSASNSSPICIRVLSSKPVWKSSSTNSAPTSTIVYKSNVGSSTSTTTVSNSKLSQLPPLHRITQLPVRMAILRGHPKALMTKTSGLRSMAPLKDFRPLVPAGSGPPYGKKIYLNASQVKNVIPLSMQQFAELSNRQLAEASKRSDGENSFSTFSKSMSTSSATVNPIKSTGSGQYEVTDTVDKAENPVVLDIITISPDNSDDDTLQEHNEPQQPFASSISHDSIPKILKEITLTQVDDSAPVKVTNTFEEKPEISLFREDVRETSIE